MRRLSILLPVFVVCCATQPNQAPPPAAPVVTPAPPPISAPQPPIVEEGLRPNENLVFGHDYKFALTTPDGLVSDPELARNLRIEALFYPPDSSWNDALALMSRVVEKTAGTGLAEIIAANEAQYRGSTPALTITDQAPIALANGQQARVRYFTEETHMLHEGVAYIDQPTSVVMIVLRGNDDEIFKKNLPLFQTLVRSYRNLQASAAATAH